MIVVLEEGGENFREPIGLAAELQYNRRQQVADILLSTIPEIEVKKGDCSQSHSTLVVKLFNDR